MLRLMVWLSLVPPIPALAVSMLVDGPVVPRPWWIGVGAVLYLGLVATTLAYAIWGRLLHRYPVATVAPFALLVPFVGAVSTSLVFGERFGPLRIAGMGVVLVGLAVIVLRRQSAHPGRTRPSAAVT
jgi:O-acetylserine/cysteine efflux transporter